jgi:hypothetical protein
MIRRRNTCFAQGGSDGKAMMRVIGFSTQLCMKKYDTTGIDAVSPDISIYSCRKFYKKSTYNDQISLKLFIHLQTEMGGQEELSIRYIWFSKICLRNRFYI